MIVKNKKGAVVHDCEDLEDRSCCDNCCGAGKGGCWCEHNCDSLCIRSCPLWLATRAAEMVGRRPPRTAKHYAIKRGS